MDLISKPGGHLSLATRIASRRGATTIVALTIIIGGAIIDAVIGEHVLSRAGATLTIFAIFALWLTFPVSDEIELGKSLQASLARDFPSAAESEDLSNIINRINPAIKSEETRNMIAATISNLAKQTPKQIASIRKVQTTLIRAQILWGAIGAFFWAFGDWIANLAFHCLSISCK
ncbi:MAG TPA: hypothetical protein VMY41_16995 [Thermohalobaculum sp.]|nr:hypothetical protein [Thermohalobaculum sp.]